MTETNYKKLKINIRKWWNHGYRENTFEEMRGLMKNREKKDTRTKIELHLVKNLKPYTKLKWTYHS